MKIRKNLVMSLGAVVLLGMCVTGCSQVSADGNNKQNSEVASSQVLSIEDKIMTADEAKEIMLEKVPGAKIVSFELDELDERYERPEYEAELVKDNMEYEIVIDAITGDIIEYEEDTDDDMDDVVLDNSVKVSDDKYIGEAKAKEIMLEKVPGAKIVSFELDELDERYERPEYEAELVKDNMEYEIVVDAINGEIIEFETDDID